MNIYFVRHGESRENELQTHDNDMSPLTDLGIKQANFLAERFKNIKLDEIYCSTMTRAIQTAEIVNKYHNLAITKTELIKEKKSPSELVGLKYDDPKSKSVKKVLNINFHNRNFRYHDEDIFEDFKKRIFQFMDEVKNKNGEILVVVHGHVLRIIVGYILFGKKFNSYDFVSLKHGLLTKNTGVTICTSTEYGLKLLTWNDHAHLAE